MKFTPKTAVTFLKQLGIQDAELVEDDEASTYDESAAFAAVDANRSVVLKPKITEEVHQTLKGKVGGLLRAELSKATGLSRKTFEEIEGDAEAIQTALKLREEKYSGDSKAMRDELDGIGAKHSQALEEREQEFNKRLKELTDRYNAKNIQEFLTEKLGSKALPDNANRKEIAKLAYNALSNEIDFSFDENENKVIALQKGTQNGALNKAKTQAYDWDEALESFLTPLGLIRKDMRDVNPMEAMQKQLGQGGEYKPQGAALGANPNSLDDYNKQRMAAMEKIAPTQ